MVQSVADKVTCQTDTLAEQGRARSVFAAGPVADTSFFSPKAFKKRQPRNSGKIKVIEELNIIIQTAVASK